LPPADGAKRKLIEVDGELQRVADAIAQVGLSPTLWAKLVELENSREALVAKIALPTMSFNCPTLTPYRRRGARVTDLGSLSERAEPAEVTAARKALRGMLGIVKVDRLGKGYADLSIGLP
jgi:hypothetical protein